MKQIKTFITQEFQMFLLPDLIGRRIIVVIV